MLREPKMPKYAGFRMVDGRIGPAVYTITMDIAPTDFGVDHRATNAEMVAAVADYANNRLKKACEAARAEGERSGVTAALKVVEDRAAAREAQVEAARDSGGEWQAVELKAGELRAMAETLRQILGVDA